MKIKKKQLKKLVQEEVKKQLDELRKPPTGDLLDVDKFAVEVEQSNVNLRAVHYNDTFMLKGKRPKNIENKRDSIKINYSDCGIFLPKNHIDGVILDGHASYGLKFNNGDVFKLFFESEL